MRVRERERDIQRGREIQRERETYIERDREIERGREWEGEGMGGERGHMERKRSARQ